MEPHGTRERISQELAQSRMEKKYAIKGGSSDGAGPDSSPGGSSDGAARRDSSPGASSDGASGAGLKPPHIASTIMDDPLF